MISNRKLILYFFNSSKLPMKILFLLFFLVACDNIEIYTKEFKEIHFNNIILKSEGIKNGNSVKFSHSGSSIYKLVEIEPMIFRIVDITVYFKDPNPAEIRVDIETKVLGLATFVWKFLIFNIIFGILFSVIFSKTLNYLVKKYLDTNNITLFK